MSSLRLVPLLCCLLLPLQGLAQTQAQGDAPVEPSTPPPLVPAPGSPQEGAPPRGELIPHRADAPRGTGRVPAGLLLGIVGGGVGAIPGLLLLTAFCDESCYQGGVVLSLTLAGAGLVGGSALTIDLVGDLMEGHGRFWPTALGAAMGAAIGILASLAAVESAGAAGLIPIALGPAVGGVIAYEISDSRVVAEAAAGATASRPRLMPLAAVSPRGGFIGGLAGSF